MRRRRAEERGASGQPREEQSLRSVHAAALTPALAPGCFQKRGSGMDCDLPDGEGGAETEATERAEFTAGSGKAARLMGWSRALWKGADR